MFREVLNVLTHRHVASVSMMVSSRESNRKSDGHARQFTRLAKAICEIESEQVQRNILCDLIRQSKSAVPRGATTTTQLLNLLLDTVGFELALEAIEAVLPVPAPCEMATAVARREAADRRFAELISGSVQSPTEQSRPGATEQTRAAAGNSGNSGALGVALATDVDAENAMATARGAHMHANTHALTQRKRPRDHTEDRMDRGLSDIERDWDQRSWGRPHSTAPVKHRGYLTVPTGDALWAPINSPLAFIRSDSPAVSLIQHLLCHRRRPHVAPDIAVSLAQPQECQSIERLGFVVVRIGVHQPF